MKQIVKLVLCRVINDRQRSSVQLYARLSGTLFFSICVATKL